MVFCEKRVCGLRARLRNQTAQTFQKDPIVMHIRTFECCRLAAVLGALGFLLVPTAMAQQPPQQPKELGAVAWMRDFDQAQAAAAKQGRPMLVLFQEVPG